jgi:hypothetical protein
MSNFPASSGELLLVYQTQLLLQLCRVDSETITTNLTTKKYCFTTKETPHVMEFPSLTKNLSIMKMLLLLYHKITQNVTLSESFKGVSHHFPMLCV